jgi:predicted ester cyclase
MSTSNPSIEVNTNVVRRLYDCINHNRADEFAAIVAPSFVDHSNQGKGPQALANGAANLHRAYADLKIEIIDMVAQGDLVAIRWLETGRHVGQFFNLKPTGQPFESRGINLYRVQEGKIVESWLGIDPTTIRAQQAAQQNLAAASVRPGAAATTKTTTTAQ